MNNNKQIVQALLCVMNLDSPEVIHKSFLRMHKPYLVTREGW